MFTIVYGWNTRAPREQACEGAACGHCPLCSMLAPLLPERLPLTPDPTDNICRHGLRAGVRIARTIPFLFVKQVTCCQFLIVPTGDVGLQGNISTEAQGYEPFQGLLLRMGLWPGATAVDGAWRTMFVRTWCWAHWWA